MKENKSVKMPRVAIVVPIYKENHNSDEFTSLRHLRFYLGHYDKYVVMPDNLRKPEFLSDFKEKKFSRAYFVDQLAYSYLLRHKNFYKSFLEYDYILIYQLDCLVFSDKLIEWCQSGFDYIGAPWFNDEMEKDAFSHAVVGNGGLSLRNVKSFVKVLENYNKLTLKVLISKGRRFIYGVKKLTHNRVKRGYCQDNMIGINKTRRFKLTFSYILMKINDKEQKNEDLFWSFDANKYYAKFKIPSVDVALGFAYEKRPSFCYKKNNNKLPFGCHAWSKYERNFWEPYLLKKENENAHRY
jgi:hypothetical protein